MEELVLFFVLVLMVGFSSGCLYRYRATIKKLLNDPKYGTDWKPSQETNLKRYIEDAEAELAELETKRN
ncbi:hypothetical protein ES703_71855 [subsurface metagenome]